MRKIKQVLLDCLIERLVSLAAFEEVGTLRCLYLEKLRETQAQRALCA